jgi:hypothetical protein
MNKALIKAVARAIEKEDIPHMKFDMWDFGSKVLPSDDETCKTVGCIAGHTVALVDGRKVLHKMDGDEISERARQLLDLDKKTAGVLFNGDHPFLDLSRVTPAVAATTLRHLAKTGKVVFNM